MAIFDPRKTAMTKADTFTPYQGKKISPEESLDRSKNFRDLMDKRRSIRFFSDRPVQKEIIENIMMTASSAPSGAHKQPWMFCAISTADLKHHIREAAEKEEYINYNGRMSEEWLEDLKKFDTDWNKEFIDIAPWIIVVFKKTFDLDEEGNRHKNYYVNESVGIASGILIAAIHNAGLVTLTHTPSPMNFLEKILERPKNEKAFLLLPVGYPADDAVVPVLQRKSEEEVIKYY